MKITPLAPKGSFLINAYGDMGFRINGERHEGSVVITLSDVLAWTVSKPEDITAQALEMFFVGQGVKPDILLIGCGPHFMLMPQALRDWAQMRGIVLEGMDTGAAARTYNILRQEERAVACVLIAVE